MTARTDTTTRLRLGGVPVDLIRLDEAIGEISARFTDASRRPLGVASINLDHIHHFGDARGGAGQPLHSGEAAPVEWLNLVDGAPIAAAARRITRADWPRLAGSDLIDALLDRAEAAHVSVGFLGGSHEAHDMLAQRLPERHPALRVAGSWSPDRSELTDDDASLQIAEDISVHGTDVLVVCLGKPRQELWIERYGPRTGAHVLLAFGAVVDFLAGRVSRAPGWVAGHGLEWAWRLALEPRRLAHRYLVDGPSAYLTLRRSIAPAIERRRAVGAEGRAVG
ncbi:WecB/TagA/CpsF family glycosyltransferase [Agromyces ramosus]|uniref:N-acetylglucosaminyldiphosphoundecaprenol N-acetyl-beta-D-mannosaminyltransferase n=1 Tax=Agromyces ramosus TaxID=33879 RepID=A0ABU0R873_9MICO|nr:WecB/TagA/CpsF family glycosyltransferase [Agromyces ramosus]MDQ0894283.1 N-acetylglucosaminyldiphosphoundecaprenol N-acetyl-beta-D-mannosaminyltransferase [Agromyces ramosus]